MTLAQNEEPTVVLLAQVVSTWLLEIFVGVPDHPFLLKTMPGGEPEVLTVVASLRVKASRAVAKEVANPRTRKTEDGARAGSNNN